MAETRRTARKRKKGEQVLSERGSGFSIKQITKGEYLQRAVSAREMDDSNTAKTQTKTTNKLIIKLRRRPTKVVVQKKTKKKCQRGGGKVLRGDSRSGDCAGYSPEIRGSWVNYPQIPKNRDPGRQKNNGHETEHKKAYHGRKTTLQKGMGSALGRRSKNYSITKR